MPWTCPSCNKTFAKNKQSHKCEVVPLDVLFEGKSPHIPELLEALLENIRPTMTATVTTSRKAITLYAPSHKAFLGIEVKQKWFDIWFRLDRSIDEFPVFKVVKPSANIYAHYVRLHDSDDIDLILIDWIQEAYDRVIGN